MDEDLYKSSAVKMEEEFIREVRSRPELYDKADKHYKDKQRKEMVWMAIGQKFKLKEPKMKWFNIRDKYVKLRKKYAAGTSNYSWRNYDNLAFLSPHLNCTIKNNRSMVKVKKEEFQADYLNDTNGVFEKDYRACSELTDSDRNPLNDDSRTSPMNDHDNDDRNIESVNIESFMGALPMMKTNSNTVEEEDEDSYFLHSIRMEMKKMSYVEKTELKISILKQIKECRQNHSM